MFFRAYRIEISDYECVSGLHVTRVAGSVLLFVPRPALFSTTAQRVELRRN